MCVCVCVRPLIKPVSGLVIKMHYHPTVSREETNSLSLCLLSLCLILILSFIYSLTPSLQGCGEVAVEVVGHLSFSLIPPSLLLISFLFSPHICHPSLPPLSPFFLFNFLRCSCRNVMQNYSERGHCFRSAGWGYGGLHSAAQ